MPEMEWDQKPAKPSQTTCVYPPVHPGAGSQPLACRVNMGVSCWGREEMVPHLRRGGNHSFRAHCLHLETNPCDLSRLSYTLLASGRDDPNQCLQSDNDHLMSLASLWWYLPVKWS